MKKILVVILSLAIIVFTTFPQSNLLIMATSQNKENSKIKENYLIISKDSKTVENIYKGYQRAQTITRNSEYNTEEDRIAVVNVNKSQLTDIISENSSVITAEKDKTVKGLTASESEKAEKRVEWNIKAVKGNKLKNKSRKERVKVAILDSGIDMFNDIDVKESINLIPGEEGVSSVFCDGSGHGTSVAGVLAAKDNNIGITGINPEVEIYSARILDDENSAPISRVIAGIDWAIDKKVDIISISFGMKDNSIALENAIKKAEGEGILIIAAAGNDGVVEYPAAYPEVMAIGSTNCEGKVSQYSPNNVKIDIAAPGEDVCSTGAFDGMVLSSGTSLSVPHVVGAASLIYEKNNDVSSEFVKFVLKQSANVKLDTDNTEFKYGLLDIEYALKNYDYFYETYYKNNHDKSNEKMVIPNTTKIQNYTKDLEVRGSWKGEKHEDCVIYAANTWGDIDAKVVEAMKKGIRYPDIEKSGYKGMGANPYFHGYFKYDTVKSYNNYIASYVYATKLAQKMCHGNQSTLDQAGIPNGLNSATASQMRQLVKNISWSDYNYTTNKLKGAFTWGVAMHIATDVYSHSVYGNYYGWRRFFHDIKNGNDYADDTSIVDLRFIIAKRVAENAIDHFVLDEPGKAQDFCEFNDNTFYDSSKFVLYNFSEYLNATGGNGLGEGFRAYSKYYTIK